jgi:hypothetical protein
MIHIPSKTRFKITFQFQSPIVARTVIPVARPKPCFEGIHLLNRSVNSVQQHVVVVILQAYQKLRQRNPQSIAPSCNCPLNLLLKNSDKTLRDARVTNEKVLRVPVLRTWHLSHVLSFPDGRMVDIA